MNQLIVPKSRPLTGRVRVSAAKNALLPEMAAALLCDHTVLEDVPRLQDVFVMAGILRKFGAEITTHGRAFVIDCSHINSYEAIDGPVHKLRASILVLGPLLARYGEARIGTPGGCPIGERPIDIHIEGLRAMNAQISINGHIEATTTGLRGADIMLPYPSVGATENLMMAATLAKGKTIIRNAAKEPEIGDLAQMLRAMGAHIEGEAEGEIHIEGKKSLSSVVHHPIPDRIETGTLMVAAAITGGDVTLQPVRCEHLLPTCIALSQAGARISVAGNAIRVQAPPRLQPLNVRSMPYPGFPTDMQAQAMALACCAEGQSRIEETVFENRFRHAEEMRKMGADILIHDSYALINGGNTLEGAQVKATDLRGGAALALAGLRAQGVTSISDVYNIDRGYERLDIKLNSLGADIRRVGLM
ncbi:MAG: UDP-N-acetylglucosamine 1-carboxyvinyltransferase [Christensenellales bacterium]